MSKQGGRLGQVEKNFNSRKNLRQVEKPSRKKSFGEMSETMECPHGPERGFGITAITDAIASAA
jgi:hypothetical protein